MRDPLDRTLELEQLSTNLASLYVATHRIHSSLERADVLVAIEEVIVNLIGAEELAIFESDGATGAHHFPGTFYDYRWSTTLARRDRINVDGTDERAAGPDNGSGIVKVPGDWRELQGTMWAHDHRFFFTAEFFVELRELE